MGEREMKRIPHLERRGNAAVLVVHDQPLILLAGEVHNSNASSAAYMERVWDQAEALGMNSLLLPVSWELVEPEEGRFDFALVDQLIGQARVRDKKLVLLWFGSWKNAECMYAPAWVKTDLARFRRGQIEKGKNKAPRQNFYGLPYTTLSYLCGEARDADAKAFAALMAHLRQFDGEENTVVAVQVENETGLLGAAREVSDEADALFDGPVPAEQAEDSVLDFGAFQVQAAFEHPMLQKKDGVCLGIQTGPDECILLACRCGLMFASGDPERPNLDILRLEEGRVENGAWRATRRLNGDEAAFLKFDEPVLLRLRVFTYA